MPERKDRDRYREPVTIKIWSGTREALIKLAEIEDDPMTRVLDRLVRAELTTRERLFPEERSA